VRAGFSDKFSTSAGIDIYGKVPSLKDRSQRKALFLNSNGSLDHGHTTLSALSETPKVLFTINHVDKKTKGFVDFDLQLNRPPIQPINAHDQRFEPYNMFPVNFSRTKVPRLISFKNQNGRDAKHYTMNMSDSLFDREKHLNLVKPKAKGILQFGRMHSKKELKTMPEEPQDPLMPSLEGHSRRKAILAILAASNKRNEQEQL
jgi:hypothetical protein